MKTVYVVTSGDYSDYSICGIFDNRETAQLFKEKVHYSNDIEEWTLNPIDSETMIGKKYYSIMFDENCNILILQESSGQVEPNFFKKYNHDIHTSPHQIYKGISYHFGLWAKDEEHAKKITFEKFAQFQLGQNY